MFKTKEELLTAVLKSLPHPNHINDLDLSSETEAVMFTWRQNKLRVQLSGHVDEVGDGVLIGSNLSILVHQLLLNYYMNK